MHGTRDQREFSLRSENGRKPCSEGIPGVCVDSMHCTNCAGAIQTKTADESEKYSLKFRNKSSIRGELGLKDVMVIA